MNQRRTEAFLRFILRWEGSVSLTALAAVLMPYSTMDAIHQWLGMGQLPDQPIVGYLTRSLSAFYAFFGALLWAMSFDVQRYRPLIGFFGVITVVFGAMLLGIDIKEGLPVWWRMWEGPIVMLIGVAIAWPAFLLKPTAAASQASQSG